MLPVLLFGDSITAGRIGIAYRRYIPISTEAHGIEGDTCTGVFKRAIHLIGRGHLPMNRIVVIQGGANDLLIPYMMKHNPRWSVVGSQLIRQDTPPLEDEQVFLDEFEASLDRLRKTAPALTAVICAIAPLGESLGSELNRARKERNRNMRNLVKRYERLTWCDISTPLENLVGETGISDRTYLLEDPANLELDARTIGTDEARAARISRERSLVFTIDGVHPNAVGARMIAESITSCLPWQIG